MPQVQLHYITLSYTTCITLHYTPLHSISSPVTLRHFCVAGVAGVALGNIDLRCRVAGVALMGLGWVWVALLGLLGRLDARDTAALLRGGHGTW